MKVNQEIFSPHLLFSPFGGEDFVVTIRQAQSDHGELVEPSAERLE